MSPSTNRCRTALPRRMLWQLSRTRFRRPSTGLATVTTASSRPGTSGHPLPRLTRGQTVGSIYGEAQRADSDSGQGWGSEGSIRIGNSTSTGLEEGVVWTGKTGWVWKARFEFRKYYGNSPSHDFCYGAPLNLAQAHHWKPDSSDSPQHAWDDSRFYGQCTTTWNAYKNLRAPGTYWSRTTSNFTAFGWNVSISPGFDDQPERLFNLCDTQLHGWSAVDPPLHLWQQRESRHRSARPCRQLT